MVVYHLRGQTGRFIMWVNGSQSSGLVNLSRNCVYHLYKSVPLTGKRPRRPETGIKDGFKKTKHEFPFGIFYPEKEDSHFRCSVAPQNFPFGRPKKSHFIYFPTGITGQFL